MATLESDSSVRRSRLVRFARPLLTAGALATCLCVSAAAHASTVQFTALINGAQEPTASLAVWSGTFVMDTDANTLSVNVVDTGAGPLTSMEIAAHIHGFAPPGMAAGILFGLPLGSPKVAVWNFTEGQQANIIAGLTYVNLHTTMNPGGEIRGQVLRVPSCGDGIVDLGEACDDGNNTNGDCCDSACQFESASTPCGTSLCDVGTCDGAGTCVAGTHGGCKSAQKSLLLIKKNSSDDTKDKLTWKWVKGGLTDVSELGNPIPAGTTAYALCVYVGTTDTLVLSADIAPSTFWQSTSTGFKYKDKPGSSDGVTKVLLKAGDPGKSKALVKGKGTNLPYDDIPAGAYPLPVTAQLVNSDNVCFENTFNAVIKDGSDGLFKAKAP